MICPREELSGEINKYSFPVWDIESTVSETVWWIFYAFPEKDFPGGPGSFQPQNIRNYGRKAEKYTDDVQKCLRNEGKSIMIRGWMIQEEHGEEK